MTTRPKILVIDDEESVRVLIAATLGDFFTVITPINGEQALRLAREERPDLILLDLRMPGRDGFELCHALRADPLNGHTPIVIITATDTPEFRQRASEAGAEGFVPKPFSPDFLLKLLMARFGIAQPQADQHLITDPS